MHAILLVTKNLFNIEDAQAQQSAKLIECLENSGFFVDVITMGTASDRLTKIRGEIFLLGGTATKYRNNSIQKVLRKLSKNIRAIRKNGNWVTPARALAAELLEQRQYRCIVTVGLPMESHIVMLGVNTKTPWISYFSDVWPESIQPKPYSDFSIPLLTGLQKKIVRQVLTASTHSVMTNKQQLQLMQEKHKVYLQNRSSVIPHIAPPLAEMRSKPSDNFTIIHAGSLSRERRCDDLAKALSMLPEGERPLLKFIGKIHPELLEPFSKFKVDHHIEIVGWKSPQETRLIMSTANALLLTEAKMSQYPFLPSKISDYASHCIPILAISGPTSPCTQLIKKYNAGISTPHDPESIAKALMEIKNYTPEKGALWHHLSSKRIGLQYRELIMGLT